MDAHSLANKKSKKSSNNEESKKGKRANKKKVPTQGIYASTYKTRWCRFIKKEEGWTKDTCIYAHSKKELRKIDDPMPKHLQGYVMVKENNTTLITSHYFFIITS